MASENWGERLTAVDRMEVLVLVDNVTDNLSSVPAGVQHEREVLLELGLQTWSGPCMCCAHHGLSLVITVETAGRRRTLLFDAGPEGYTVERNGRALGVDFAAIEAVMLSHGHWDHGGGLIAAIKLIRDTNDGAAVPFYFHPDGFRRRGIRFPNGFVLPFADVPKPAALQALGAEVRLSAAPQAILDDCFFISGEIPRVTAYEAGLPGHVRQAETGGDDWEDDPWIMDERFLAVHVKGKGLVVFSACSHAGIVNVMTEARARFPGLPLHAAMGGLHLSGAAVEKIIPETVADLDRFALTQIVPAHCTGWRAVGALVERFGEDRVSPSAVGRRYNF